MILTNEFIYWVLVIAFLILIYNIWNNDSFNDSSNEHYDNDSKSNLNLSQSEIRTLKGIAKSYAAGNMSIPNLRITGDLVVDGATRCKRNLTAREINSIRVSGNIVDGATVKGEIVKDNENLLVKRGQRIRITDGSGMYQVWAIEKDE
jgi:DNA/RNA endonuclease YhcR with UshA esterase domain